MIINQGDARWIRLKEESNERFFRTVRRAAGYFAALSGAGWRFGSGAGFAGRLVGGR
jgi:hypothetical protein